MNDDCTRSALAGSTEILVIPAPVPEACLAGEQIRIPVRVVVHDDEDLALEIGILEIVPIVFGCLDCIADEHEFGIR